MATPPARTEPAAAAELAVTRNVPAAILPPPPPPPPAADLSSASQFAAEGAGETDRSATLKTTPVPVPYSFGAESIAADTPNAIPSATALEPAPAVGTPDRLASPSRAAGAPRTVEGYVRDDAGEPLPGVMVTTPGVPAGLFTDSAGYFQLGVDRNVDRLIFQNTGYADEEIAVEGEDAYFEITLDEAVTESVSFDEAFAKTTIIPDDRPTRVAPPGGYRQLRRQLRAEKPAGLPAGRVRLEFTVTAAGELRRFRVLETPDQDLSRWLVDRLRQTGEWTFYHGTGPHTVRYSVNFE